jgi:hypothetical protein
MMASLSTTSAPIHAHRELNCDSEDINLRHLDSPSVGCGHVGGGDGLSPMMFHYPS